MTWIVVDAYDSLSLNDGGNHCTLRHWRGLRAAALNRTVACRASPQTESYLATVTVQAAVFMIASETDPISKRPIKGGSPLPMTM